MHQPVNMIDLPSAEELDSGCWEEHSGWRGALYLVPAAEAEDGRPAVVLHSGLGTIGEPMSSYHRRWRYLGSYGPRTVGQSVVDALVADTDVLIALSDAYAGSEWDGNNLRGRWTDSVEDLDRELWGDFRCYWDAHDWFGPANHHWPELCQEAGIDPERALGDDWTAVAREVAAVVKPLQDELVEGVESYAIEMAALFRDGADA